MHTTTVPSPSTSTAPHPSSQMADMLAKIDVLGFMNELKQLRLEINRQLGAEDIRHLRKIESWGHISTLIGLLTAWRRPNLLSAFALGLGRSTRWLLMHHIGHRGYDQVPGIPKRYTSKHFARGWRRWIDWPDWMTPESWNYEHNILHHAHTGERSDPDLLERNAHSIRESNMPLPLRYALMIFLGMSWKPVYYAPSNIHALHTHAVKPDDGSFQLDADMIAEVIFDCYLPYMLMHFMILPTLFLPAGPWAVFSVWCNSIMADWISNFHGFFVVTPNHTAGDLYRFETKPAHKGEWLIRQVIGSVNYQTGKDWLDYLQFWLNYQIEHHIWPDLPMLKYQQYQPQVQALCEKYGVPYLQENVFARFRKMLDVSTGQTSMKRLA